MSSLLSWIFKRKSENTGCFYFSKLKNVSWLTGSASSSNGVWQSHRSRCYLGEISSRKYPGKVHCWSDLCKFISLYFNQSEFYINICYFNQSKFYINICYFNQSEFYINITLFQPIRCEDPFFISKIIVFCSVLW